MSHPLINSLASIHAAVSEVAVVVNDLRSDKARLIAENKQQKIWINLLELELERLKGQWPPDELS